ncbi:hypothetical protein OOZ51_03365 [Arthrobacter sp. MI7-26]|nr:hypothetical protein [Arthrobacter sp. MI7-26]MCX2746851.1 hypothetical protein [Arthrobacter sp. MI7-26]
MALEPGNDVSERARQCTEKCHAGQRRQRWCRNNGKQRHHGRTKGAEDKVEDPSGDSGNEPASGVLPGALRIEMAPLYPAEVQEWSREHLEKELAFPAARALVEHTAGNPSLTVSLMKQFPSAVRSGGAELLPTPTGLLASVASRLLRLPPEAAALVEAASVLGSDPQLALASDVAEISDPVRDVEAAESRTTK